MRHLHFSLFTLACLFFHENVAAQTCSVTCQHQHPAELMDFASEFSQPPSQEKSSLLSTFSGTVQYPNGTIVYSKMLIYDPLTFEVISSDWVCLGGVPFSIPVPPGIYNVYYRPFALGGQAYEVLNVDLTSNLDTTLVLTPYSTPNYMTDLSWSKLAIFADDNETVSITATTNNSYTIVEIYWFNEFNVFINPAVPFSQAKIRLKDDGLGADLMAGDGIFTSIPIKYNISVSLARSGNLSSANLIFFQVDDAVNGLTGYGYNGPSLGLVNPDAVTFNPPVQVNANVYVSDYLINIVRPPAVNNIGDAQTVYSIFPDSFDFINIFHSNHYIGAAGIHYTIQNGVTGIGTPIFDESPQYGSAGKLQGISIFPKMDVEHPMNHEVMHQWAMRLNSLFNSTAYGSHNGYSTIDGVLGGIVPPFTINNPTSVSFDFVSSGGYKSDQKAFADLELYLMGALDTGELRDQFHVLYDPVYQNGNTYTVSSIDTITPQDIVSTYGYRSPSPQNADTDFRTATVVISDAPLNSAASTFYTYLAKAWANEIPEFYYESFAEAAQFQATMKTVLPIGCTSLSSPANGATNVPGNASLSWATANYYADGYKLRAGTTPGGSNLLNSVDVGNVTTYTPPGFLPFNTTVYVTIIPYNLGGDTPGCMEKHFTTGGEPLAPGCTQLLAPLSGAVNVQPDVTISWSVAYGNPSGYRLTVGTSPGGTQILDNFDVGNVTTFDPPGDFPVSSTIYVRITPYKATGEAMGCAQESFATVAPPSCTNLVSPFNGATLAPFSTVLTWAAALGNPTGYLLSIGTTAGGTQILNNYFVGNVTSYNPPGNFPQNTTIYVRIKPLNAGGQATGCAEESFTTTTGNCLGTPFDGQNFFHGNMFKITNNSSQYLEINSFEIHAISIFGGPGNVEIYYTTSASTFIGNETNPAAWTLLGAASVNMLGTNQATPLPIGGLVLAPGQSKGMYVTTDGNSFLYNTVGAAAFLYSDGNFTIDVANQPTRITYPFSSPLVDRRWNGNICYSFGTTTALCSSLASPAHGAANVPISAPLTWAASPGTVIGYKLRIGTSPGGTQILNNVNVGNVLTYAHPSGLPYNTTIYVTVIPQYPSGEVTGCPEKSFTTAPVPLPVPNCTSLDYPVNATNNVPVTTTLGWTAAGGSPAGYLLSVGTTSGGTQLLNNLDVGNVTTYDPPGDLPFLTTIYVKIKPYNATGANLLCPEKSFTTVCQTAVFYADLDNDSYGDAAVNIVACSAPSGYVPNNSDCNDSNGGINPAATEVCNGTDDDCSGSPEAATNTWTGGGDGVNWSDSANWSDGMIPLSCQDVVLIISSNVQVGAGITAFGKTLDVPVSAQLHVNISAILNIQN